MALILKSLHVFGVCLFIGNIIVSAVWKVMADRTGNLAVIQFATRLVNVTDVIFTGVGVALLLVTGHLLAGYYGGVTSQEWILWSYVLFGISGVIWIFVLVPIQFKQARLLRSAAHATVPEQYYRLARLWSWAGTVATLVPLPAIYLMISKGA